MNDIRVGHGFDVHAFAENRRLIVGGVEIPYQLGLQPKLVESDNRNLKVTYPQDMELASLIQASMHE